MCGRGHSVSHSELGTKTGFWPILGRAQDLHYLIPLGQSFIGSSERNSLLLSNFSFYLGRKRMPQKEKGVASDLLCLSVRVQAFFCVFYAFSLCLQLQRKAERWRSHGRRRDGGLGRGRKTSHGNRERGCFLVIPASRGSHVPSSRITSGPAGGDPTHSYFSLAPLKMPNTPQPLGYHEALNGPVLGFGAGEEDTGDLGEASSG